ncbi:MAG: phosphoribosyltransferase, partial [bacterium]
MTFRDRRDAGQRLAEALQSLRRRRPFVLAIPRGGIVVGYHVARALDAPLDVVVPRKLRAPYNPELAIGAVAYDGSVYLDAAVAGTL